MKKLWFFGLLFLCGISLFFSIFLMAAPPEPVPEPQPVWFLRDQGGRLALFRPNDPVPLQIYPVYIHLLPEADVESLRRGLPVYREEELDRLIEDFGG